MGKFNDGDTVSLTLLDGIIEFKKDENATP
jgi:hypothetical protein